MQVVTAIQKKELKELLQQFDKLIEIHQYRVKFKLEFMDFLNKNTSTHGNRLHDLGPQTSPTTIAVAFLQFQKIIHPALKPVLNRPVPETL